MVDRRGAHELLLQGADDMVAGESGEGTGAADRVDALRSCEAEAAAGLADPPSSSNGGAPHLQNAVETLPKRTALPEHARMVAELQVCPACPPVRGKYAPLQNAQAIPHRGGCTRCIARE